MVKYNVLYIAKDCVFNLAANLKLKWYESHITMHIIVDKDRSREAHQAHRYRS